MSMNISLRCDDIFPPRRCPECGGSDFELHEIVGGPTSQIYYQCIGLLDPGHEDKPLEACWFTFEPNQAHFY